MREVISTVPEVKPIATIENTVQIKLILNLLVRHSTKKLRITIWEWIFLANILVVIIGALLTAFKPSTAYGAIASAIGLLIASVILAVFAVVFVLPRFLKILLNPVQAVLQAEVEREQLDSDLLYQLRQYDTLALRYVEQRMRMAVEHFRGRIGTIAGEIYKVGLIPLLVGWFFAGEKFLQGTISSRYITIGACGLVVFYIQSVVAVLASNRIEQLAQIVRFVLDNERDLQEQKMMDDTRMC